MNAGRVAAAAAAVVAAAADARIQAAVPAAAPIEARNFTAAIAKGYADALEVAVAADKAAFK